MAVAEIVDRPNGEPDVMVIAQPRCGDYCDSCGDCLYCYGGYDCANGGDHRWVVYADLEPERAAELLRAPSTGGTP